MLKVFNFGRNMHCGFWKPMMYKRTFLSEAYRCEKAWNDRLQSPLLQKYPPEDLFIILENKFHCDKKVSALDIDIFANSIQKKQQVEELLSLLQKLRKTAEATNILDSTHHAVIRYLLNNECTNELMNILHDRLNFGIFPDYLCYNILMDTYIKKEDYSSAAKIAVLPMLQEDSEHLITNALSIYSCHKYLENPDTWQKPPEPVDDSKEEIKIRVDYLRNPFFDDHFDLTEPCDLVGKTLAFQGKFMNNELGRTCQLRGLILYKKYQDVSKLIKQWLNGVEGNIVYNEVFKLIEKDKKDILKEQATNEFEHLMSEVNVLKQKALCMDSLNEALENNVKSAVNKQHDIDINKQMQIYTEWEEKRQLVLNKQLEEINRQIKLKEINKMKEEMHVRERFLTFFENREKIELEIEKIKSAQRKENRRILRIRGARKKLKMLEEQKEYIPPLI
ncbi:28S ribosomal protein S27, mitochondrial [Eufriesea mexicana]|uniref:28S ribosomal protein S27, mitochondrial n=2 Tax=Eufriesea mexicana TaxID=516756 RepID=A0A310SST8_9HYME|nr:28S ribosomal protein S27, mitochondrial [Eufriesea mexicana]